MSILCTPILLQTYSDTSPPQIVPCMCQERDSDGSQYRASGWLGVITAGKLWTDFKGAVLDLSMVEAQTDKLLIEIANKFEIGKSIVRFRNHKSTSNTI